MIENRGGCGLYYSPAETQIVARRVAENTISARTPMVKLLEVEYSLPDIQLVLSRLLPNHSEVVKTLSDYTEGEDAIKAVLDLLPLEKIGKSPSVLGDFITAVAIEGIAERYDAGHVTSVIRQDVVREIERRERAVRSHGSGERAGPIRAKLVGVQVERQQRSGHQHIRGD